MRIYHFSNDSFGIYFYNTFKVLKKSFPNIYLTMVRSNLTSEKVLQLIPLLEKRKVKNKLNNQGVNFYDRISITKNINKEKLNIDDEAIAIVSGFNQIFSEETINKFKEVINIHPSLLPYYRGPVPSYWCLKNGESYSGYTIHRMTRRIDEGEILAQGIVEINENDTVNSLDAKIAKLAAEQLLTILKNKMNNVSMENRVINAKAYYKKLVNYKSFPKLQN